MGRNGPWQQRPKDRENVSIGFSLSLIADSLLIPKSDRLLLKNCPRGILRLHMSERDVIGIPSSSEGRNPPCENSTNPLTIQRILLSRDCRQSAQDLHKNVRSGRIPPGLRQYFPEFLSFISDDSGGCWVRNTPRSATRSPNAWSTVRNFVSDAGNFG